MEILGAVLLGILLAALDQTIVGTALPRIVTDLKGNDVYTWAFTGYLLTATASGPIYGKLSDLFGRRPLFLIGVGIFLVGSALSGLSHTMWQLIAFRSLQGLGAGALFPISIAIIGDIFSPSERGKYLGFFGAVFGLSSLIGPAIGGILTDTVGWQWIFYVNLPLGAVVLLVIWRTLPTVVEPGLKRKVDYLGAATLVGALFPILIGLTNKQFGDWTDPQVGGLIALGLAFAAVFIWAESRAEEPILPLFLFRIRAFTASVFAIFLAAMGFFTAIVFLPRWYQVVGGASATESGYQILPMLAGLILSATISGQLVARTGRYKALIGASLLILAVGLFLLTNLRSETDRPLVWLWMAITGVGIGPSFAVFTLVVQNAVPVNELGVGTEQHHALPAGWRHRGPGDHRLDLRLLAAGGDAQADRRQGGARGPRARSSPRAGSGAQQPVGSGDLGSAILAQVPAAQHDQVAPLIPSIVAGIHEAILARHRLDLHGGDRDGAARGAHRVRADAEGQDQGRAGRVTACGAPCTPSVQPSQVDGLGTRILASRCSLSACTGARLSGVSADR